MATNKKATAKPVAKPTRNSGGKSAKPVKKALPAKKVAQKKAAKPAPKAKRPIAKVAVKKALPPAKKMATKKAIVVKKTVNPAVKVVKSVSKPAKPVAKPVKAIAKQAKSVAKPVIQKATIIKKVLTKAVQPALKPMTKKEEIKKTVAAKAPAAPKSTVDIKAKDIKVPAAKPVVIPKISTKTVRKYQPDFTKSVLDKAERDPGAPTQRYSDPELLEFKELIQRKLEAAKKELSYLHGLITRKDEMGGDEGDNRYMTMEDGSLSMEREQLSQMASRQITFIDHLEKAIMRIENKTYGICRVTGKLIDKARLRAVPHATLSIEAKMGAVK
jgi:RNA polymerase-binding transcription factor DksA